METVLKVGFMMRDLYERIDYPLPKTNEEDMHTR